MDVRTYSHNAEADTADRTFSLDVTTPSTKPTKHKDTHVRLRHDTMLALLQPGLPCIGHDAQHFPPPYVAHGAEITVGQQKSKILEMNEEQL